MSVVLPKVTVEQLKDQITDPAHVYIEVRPGRFFSHAFNLHEEPGCTVLRGHKVRFTRLAAERMVASLGWTKARLVPCEPS